MPPTRRSSPPHPGGGYDAGGNTGAAGLHRTGDISSERRPVGRRSFSYVLSGCPRRPPLSPHRISHLPRILASPRPPQIWDVHRPHRQRRTTHTPCGAGYSACVHAHAVSFPLLYPHSSAARLAVGTLLSAIITPHTVEARQNTSAAAISATTGESAPSGALSFFLYTKFVNADPRGPSPLRFRTEGGSPPDTGSPSGY